MEINSGNKIKLLEFIIISWILMQIICVKSAIHEHPHGHQIQLQFSGSQKFDYRELTEILEHAEVKDRKIVVVSIIGAYRKGKSFFLDYCLRYLYCTYPSINRIGRENFERIEQWWGEPDEPLRGFSWAPGSTAHTKGILIWNDIFLHDSINGEKLAIMIMDTQGLFELKGDSNFDAKVFGITSFLSSVEIFNLNDVIQENQLEYLKMVTDFAKIVIHRQTEKSVMTSSKTFQELLLLIRDWSDDEIGYGKDGGEEYLRTKVFEMDFGDDSVADYVRSSIKDSFDNITAFLLPHPGLQVKSRNYNGCWSSLDKSFLDLLKNLIESLFSPNRLVTKKIFGNEMTAQELSKFAESLFVAFQSPNIPQIDSLFNTIVESQLRKQIENLFEEYKKELNARLDYSSNNFKASLFNMHSVVQNEIIVKFKNTPKLSDAKMESQFLDYLISKTFAFFNEWKTDKIESFKSKMRVKVDELFEKYQNLLRELLKMDERNFMSHLSEIQESATTLVVKELQHSPQLGDLNIDSYFKDNLKNKINSYFTTWKQDKIEKFKYAHQRRLESLVQQLLDEYKNNRNNMVNRNGNKNFITGLLNEQEIIQDEILRKFDNSLSSFDYDTTDEYREKLKQQISSYFDLWKTSKIESFKYQMKNQIDDLYEKYKKNLDEKVDINDSNIIDSLLKHHEKFKNEILNEFEAMPKTGDIQVDSDIEMSLKRRTHQHYTSKAKEVEEIVKRKIVQRRNQNLLVDLYFEKYKKEIESCVNYQQHEFYKNLHNCRLAIENAKIRQQEENAADIEISIREEAKSNLKTKIQDHYGEWYRNVSAAYQDYVNLNTEGIWVTWNGDIPKNAVIGGHDIRGRTIYVARAEHLNTGTHVARFAKGDIDAFYGYNGRGYKNRRFEILTHTSPLWENKSGTGNILISGGNGQYVCRVHYDGEVITGKLHFGRCHIEHSQNEKSFGDWETLKRAP